MKKFALVAAASGLMLIGGAGAAFADDCSGRDHTTGTVLGAAGGAAIGGLASHSVAGAVIGGVAGGVAGNAIDRAQDCTKIERRADLDRDQLDAYRQGYEDRDAQADSERQAAYDQGYRDRSVGAVPDYAPRMVVAPAPPPDGVTVIGHEDDDY
jgi:hypothetical protein